MQNIPNQLESGFLVRVKFHPKYAAEFSDFGTELAEIIYPDLDGIFELENFLVENKHKIDYSMVWFADGRLFEGNTFPLRAES